MKGWWEQLVGGGVFSQTRKQKELKVGAKPEQGEESKAKCIQSFLSEAANLIGGESVENTLYMINALVDKTFDNIDKQYNDENGVQQTNKKIKKWIKYGLAFKVSQQLPPGYMQLRPFLRKWTAD